MVGVLAVADKQIINAFVRHSARCGFVLADLLVFEELCRLAEETLFRSITSNPYHVLYRLLPPQSSVSQNYYLQRRFHNSYIPAKVNNLNYYITRMLYSDP